MEELDIATITKRSIHGILALVSRTFLIQVVAFITNFLLTIFLTPSTFGVYFVVSAAINFLGYFSDIGLAAALIQKKEEITREELKTTFTIQQVMVISVVLVALLISGWIGAFYRLNLDGVRLFQALAIAFFLSSLKTIPSIILERKLFFQKLVIPQIVETIVFSVVAVTLAIKGYGISSFTYAVLARGITGLITMYVVAPWKIGVGFSKTTAKKLLSFGVPFQLNSILALFKDDLFIAYLGKALPIAQVGYIGFAQKWAFTPLRLIMDNVIRITFPSFSRLQDEKEILSKAIEKAVFASSFFIFPSIVGMISLAPYFISIIPRYAKWEPAIFSLAFFGINAAMSSISTPLTNALNAIGQIKKTLYLMIFWTIATWVLTPLAIIYFGFNGVAIASAIISLSVIIVVLITRQYVNFNPLIALYPFLASVIMGIVIYIVSPFLIVGGWGLLAVILIAIVVYFLSMLIFSKQELTSNLRLIIQNLKK
jgi:O-antigen/teichoic acid export membrane protein